MESGSYGRKDIQMETKELIHGRYPKEIETKGVDQMASVTGPKSGALFPETERFI